MPHELFGRFSSKSDFIRYFRDNCKCTTTASPLVRSATVPASRVHDEQRLPQRSLQRREATATAQRSQPSQRASLRRVGGGHVLAHDESRRALHAVLPEQAAEGESAGPRVLLEYYAHPQPRLRPATRQVRLDTTQLVRSASAGHRDNRDLGQVVGATEFYAFHFA